MRTANKWEAAIALMALLFAARAGALGLGAINVNSGLGQPFSASIPLRLDSPSDLDGLTVTLAKPAAFRRAGVAPSEAVSTLQFKVVEGQGGAARIQVNGKQPVREPFLNFIVDVQWNDGTLLREYTVLLNPPAYGPHRAVSGARTLAASRASGQRPSAKSEVVPIPELAGNATDGARLQSRAKSRNRPDMATAQPVPQQVRQSSRSYATLQTPTREGGMHQLPRSESGSSAEEIKAYQLPPSPPLSSSSSSSPSSAPVGHSRTYGPVKAGQTFWSIAKGLRPNAAVTLDQVLLSIYKANPTAFYQGHFNGLMKGARLRIPSEAAMKAVSPAAAAAKVAALRAQAHSKAHSQARRKPAPRADLKQNTRQADEHASKAAEEHDEVAAVSGRSSSGESQAGVETRPEPAVARSVHQPEALNVATTLAAASVESPVSGSANPAAETAGGGAQNNRENINSNLQKIDNKEEKSSIGNEDNNGAGESASNQPASAASTGAVAAAVAASASSGEAASSSIPRAGSESGAAPAPASRVSEHDTASASAATGSSTVVPQTGKSAQGAARQTAGTSTESGGVWLEFLDGVNWVLVGLLAVLALLGLMFVGRRRGRADEGELPPDSPSEPDGSGADESGTREPVVVIRPGSEEGLTEEDGVEVERVDSPVPGDEVPEPGFDADVEQGNESPQAATLAATVGGTQAFAVANEGPNSTAVTPEDLLADAEFNLSYGLYDEAATLFKQAAKQYPERNDIELRLAETYFEAGEANKFELLAAELKDRLNAGQWRELAAKGRRLCPDSDLFDQQATPPFESPQSDDDGLNPASRIPPDAAETVAFTASDLDDPVVGLEPPARENDAQNHAPGDNVIKFDMPSVDDEPLESAGRAQSQPSDASSNEGLDRGFDRSIDAAARERLGDAPDPAEFNGAGNLEGEGDSHIGPGRPDFDLDNEERSGKRVSSDSSPGTDTAGERESDRIELARIYASMGDNDAARDVIRDILKDGNAAEKAAADALARTLAE